MQNNCRPVSLILVMGKLLESILRDRMNCHVERHGPVRDGQRAFVEGRSCLTNLIELFEDLKEGLITVVQWMFSTWNLARRLTRSHMVDWSKE